MSAIPGFSRHFFPTRLPSSRFRPSGLFAVFLASASFGAFAQNDPGNADGPKGTAGVKTLSLECWGIGDNQRATRDVSLTVTRPPAARRRTPSVGKR